MLLVLRSWLYVGGKVLQPAEQDIVSDAEGNLISTPAGGGRPPTQLASVVDALMRLRVVDALIGSNDAMQCRWPRACASEMSPTQLSQLAWMYCPKLWKGAHSGLGHSEEVA